MEGHSGTVAALPGYELLSNTDMFIIHILIYFSGHDILIFIQVNTLLFDAICIKQLP